MPACRQSTWVLLLLVASAAGAAATRVLAAGEQAPVVTRRSPAWCFHQIPGCILCYEDQPPQAPGAQFPGAAQPPPPETIVRCYNCSALHGYAYNAENQNCDCGPAAGTAFANGTLISADLSVPSVPAANPLSDVWPPPAASTGTAAAATAASTTTAAAAAAPAAAVAAPALVPFGAAAPAVPALGAPRAQARRRRTTPTGQLAAAATTTSTQLAWVDADDSGGSLTPSSQADTLRAFAQAMGQRGYRISVRSNGVLYYEQPSSSGQLHPSRRRHSGAGRPLTDSQALAPHTAATFAEANVPRQSIAAAAAVAPGGATTTVMPSATTTVAPSAAATTVVPSAATTTVVPSAASAATVPAAATAKTDFDPQPLMCGACPPGTVSGGGLIGGTFCTPCKKDTEQPNAARTACNLIRRR